MSSAIIQPVRPFNGRSIKKTNKAFENWRVKQAKLCIEIGCGVGLHPIQWCSHNPGKSLLAFERTKDKFNSFSRRSENHHLPNLYPVHADASDWLPSFWEDQKVDEIYMLYPNPYPKEKQANKRWHRSAFCHYLLSILKQGGVIHTATNEVFFAEECLTYAKEFWGLETVTAETLPKDGSWVPRTHFEKKYLLRGETCFKLEIGNMRSVTCERLQFSLPGSKIVIKMFSLSKLTFSRAQTWITPAR